MTEHEYRIGQQVIAIDHCEDGDDIFKRGDVGVVLETTDRDVRIDWLRTDIQWWTYLNEFEPLNTTIGNTQLTEGAKI